MLCINKTQAKQLKCSVSALRSLFKRHAERVRHTAGIAHGIDAIAASEEASGKLIRIIAVTENNEHALI